MSHRLFQAALCGSLAAIAAGNPAGAAEPTVLPEAVVTASRLGEGVTGAATTVITEDDIARSPGKTLQEVLARQPGIQLQSFFGDGARDTVDMRGFGAAATANTLVLVNGRRLNDIDLAGVDFAAIPLDNIERIEIVRGNAGAVLYGDGAVGGAINIITKTGANLPPAYRAEAGIGSHGYRDASASVRQPVGDIVASLHAGYAKSDGWRENNELRQRNIMGEVRQSNERGDLYLNLSADDQELGLPGARRVDPTAIPPINQLIADRNGTDTPLDYADKQGLNATVGGSRFLSDAVELVLDAGVRWKAQQSAFFSAFGPDFDIYHDTTMTTLSLTPRLNIHHGVFGASGHAITGMDVYHTQYESERKLREGLAPHNDYDIDQTTAAFYAQETVDIGPDTQLSAGARVQYLDLSARDRVDPTAPGGAFLQEGLPLDDSEWNYALHLGIEHRLASYATLFARVGRSFRLPNVDERVGQAPWGTPTTFALDTQTSQDIEAGLRGAWGPFTYQTSAYLMELDNEIHFSPATFTNVNLDPTRRWGVETAATWQVLETVRVRGNVAYTRATFREGDFSGNDVPLVSRWTAGGGVSWDVWGPWLVVDADARYIGPRRFDNDQANSQGRIPAHTVFDLRLGGAIEAAHWSIAVQNLFDEEYFDYGIASAFTPGAFNAYPQPGRTVIGRVGVSF